MNASLLALALATVAAAPPDGVYDFYSDSCGPCHAAMPTVHALQQEGLPIYTINSAQRPDLVAQFGVNALPTFLLVIGGVERDRVEGWRGPEDGTKLRAMLARVPRSKPEEIQVVDQRSTRAKNTAPVRTVADGASKFRLPIPVLGGRKKVAPTVKVDNASQPGSTPVAGVTVERDREPTAKETTRAAAPVEEVQTDPLVQWSRTSVRIKVHGEQDVECGSGTVLESRREGTLILTCAHVLRDAKPESQIEVDAFERGKPRTYRGKVVKFDLESDVGLVTIVTDAPLPVSKVAGQSARVSDHMVGVGCNGGDLPTVERVDVTALNRYLGPDTVECTGVPIPGRSGGALFNSEGLVAGVCTNADPREKRGVYAGLKPIHTLLHAAGYGRLVPKSANPAPQEDIFAETPTTPPAKRTPAKPEPSKLEASLAQMSDAQKDAPPIVREPPTREAVVEESVAAATAGNEDAEIVCIIRPLKKPQSASRVVIINRASPKFMEFLNGEVKDQLQPTMRSIPVEKAVAKKTATAEADAVAAKHSRARFMPPVDTTQTAHRYIRSERSRL